MYRVRISDNQYKITIVDHILDNIYGQVGLTKLEKEIERLSIFKRLHDISQLGLTNIVFPCALHNRYVHSIGVMHMAGEMASHININMRKPFFNDNDIQIIRLAGLLHDIGHYPMSHNIESSYMHMERYGDIQEGNIEDILKYYTNLPNVIKSIFVTEEMGSKDYNKNITGEHSTINRFHHEKIGSEIIKNNSEIHRIVKENFVLIDNKLNPYFRNDNKDEYSDSEIDEITKKLLIVIGEIIIGNYDCKLDEKYEWANKYSAMLQIIHSDLDADNIDYLLRDATFSGTTYGILDTSVLLNALVVTELKICGKRKYIIGIRRKGIGSIEHFLFNKLFAYKQMIFTKYVSILEAMLFHIEYQFSIKDKEYFPENIIKFVKDKNTRGEYLRFNDSYIKNQIYKYKDSIKNSKTLDYIISDKLSKKIAFDCDDEKECICTSNNLKDIKSVFCNNLCVKELKEIVDKIRNKKAKDLSIEEQKQLFSYRFEKIELTKQIKKEEFKKKLKSEKNVNYKISNIYKRLANGIPVIDAKKSYFINDIGDIWRNSNIPDLCVDTKESLLCDNCNLVYISLRKYKIC